MKKYLIILLVIGAPLIYVFSCNGSGNPDIGNEVVFEKRLSSYKLFEGDPAQLIPADGVERYELSSTLFTDYAEKLRLMRLPPGKKLSFQKDGLPIFPEGTLLAKTFYYEFKEGRGKQIVETRLLLFAESRWNVATYKWNDNYSDAVLLEDGGTVTVRREKGNGTDETIAYHIPSRQECVSCHHSNNEILPIGPKLRNLNRMVERGGEAINQLQFLTSRGVIHEMDSALATELPDYTDKKQSTERRVRAYLDINCAHCHRPGGYAGTKTLNLDYSASIDQSGIKFNKNNILVRMNEMGEFHMPKLGTTVIDQEGLKLIRQYIASLK